MHARTIWSSRTLCLFKLQHKLTAPSRRKSSASHIVRCGVTMMFSSQPPPPILEAGAFGELERSRPACERPGRKGEVWGRSVVVVGGGGGGGGWGLFSFSAMHYPSLQQNRCDFHTCGSVQGLSSHRRRRRLRRHVFCILTQVADNGYGGPADWISNSRAREQSRLSQS